jgi:hypothetical protein
MFRDSELQDHAMSKHRLLLLLLVLSAMLSQSGEAAAKHSGKFKHVPFVGCVSNGQAGHQDAPDAQDDTVASEAPKLANPIAQGLAYYRSTNLGVLAPRGWHCLGLYGSGGATLIVTPEQHGEFDFFKGERIKGPAVVLNQMDGGTSGRFSVARAAARLFPNRKDFVQSVIDGWSLKESDFPFGPYPRDIVRNYNDDVAEFETPSNMEGIGTDSLLIKSAEPISGIARFDRTGDVSMTMIFIRLPANMRYLTANIEQSNFNIPYVGPTP